MPTQRPAVLLVDGHSMIFAWPDLERLHRHRTAQARQELIERLVRHQDSTGQTVVIVFDGRGGRTSADVEETRLQVFYSKSGQSADSVIERFVAKYGTTHEITVATDDHLEQTTVEAFGGRAISSERLLQEMQIAEKDLTVRLQRLRQR